MEIAIIVNGKIKEMVIILFQVGVKNMERDLIPFIDKIKNVLIAQ